MNFRVRFTRKGWSRIVAPATVKLSGEGVHDNAAELFFDHFFDWEPVPHRNPENGEIERVGHKYDLCTDMLVYEWSEVGYPTTWRPFKE